ncbi:S8 family peptidase [Streptomyces sp. RerS4]|uniref:S8 family peptidase n=1 Tax=Streptomyces sp. RerS4 TaxID=2942449 RepID=UPI00201BF1D2|nr:S8 family peptidase [Streptomyces sp. RerS4]UQX02282.1 S8 family peptidase [Streptomyces sp. RerS4]
MRMLVRLAVAALLTTTPALAAGAAAADTPEPTPVPLHSAVANALPGQYIVSLDRGVDATALANKLNLKPSFVYRTAMNGFAASLSEKQLNSVRTSLGVTSVEQDATASAPPTPIATPSGRVPANSWGLDRVDQRDLPLDSEFTVGGNGAPVTAYILDTGIDYKHEEFGGRATYGFDAMGDGRLGADCNGHGTHVAGTVGGKTYGVATKANLVSVRVLGCDGRGSFSGIIAGLDWVARNAQQPAVLNGSLGGGYSQALNDAANNLSRAGVLPVIAAGNDSRNAANYSPASAERALTVAASNRYDVETAFSNYGEVVDLYAPGQDILSARLGGGTVALNGTSMAAPHVAGAAVLFKQKHPNATPDQVFNALVTSSTKDRLSFLGTGSPNRLLFTGGL